MCLWERERERILLNSLIMLQKIFSINIFQIFFLWLISNKIKKKIFSTTFSSNNNRVLLNNSSFATSFFIHSFLFIIIFVVFVERSKKEKEGKIREISLVSSNMMLLRSVLRVPIINTHNKSHTHTHTQLSQSLKIDFLGFN